MLLSPGEGARGGGNPGLSGSACNRIEIPMLKSIAINLLLCASALWGAGHKTQNVIILMSDGVRWQDVFEGVDPGLLTADNAHSDNIPRLKRQFARPNAKEQRRALMPFLWSEIAKKGQIYGNRAL